MAAVLPAWRNLPAVYCCSCRLPAVRASASREIGGVVTASRPAGKGGVLRIMGPGREEGDGPGVIGRVLSFDEFFGFPNSGPIPFPEPGVPLESLVYFLDDIEENDEGSTNGYDKFRNGFNDFSGETNEDVGSSNGTEIGNGRGSRIHTNNGGDPPRHGIQIHIDSDIRMPVSSEINVEEEKGKYGNGDKSNNFTSNNVNIRSNDSGFGSLQVLTHVREASFTPSFQMGESEKLESNGVNKSPESVNSVEKVQNVGDLKSVVNLNLRNFEKQFGIEENVLEDFGKDSVVSDLWRKNGTEDEREKLASGNSGATVRVVSGIFGNITAPPPLQDIILLDILMRPGASVDLPIPSSYGALLYIVEGAALVGGCYSNEGHAVWLPSADVAPVNVEYGDVAFGDVATADVAVRTHPWSALRLLVLAARDPGRWGEGGRGREE